MLLLAGMTHIAFEFELGLKFTSLKHTMLLKMCVHTPKGNVCAYMHKMHIKLLNAYINFTYAL